MKFKALLIAAAAFLAACSVSELAKAQPSPVACQWNYAMLPADSVTQTATATYCGNVVTQGTTLFASLTSIPAMQALPVPFTGETVSVSGTQGGIFIWNLGNPPYGSACAAGVGGDGGTSFCSTVSNAGYWKRSFKGALTSLMFGTDPTNVADSTAAMQLAFNAASSAALGLPIEDPAAHFKLSDTLIPTIGMTYTGAGMGSPTPGASGTILDWGTMSGKPCMALQLPNGTETVVGASFFNGAQICPNGTYGIRQNSIAGGFTNDNTTQQYLFDVTIGAPGKQWYISGGTTAAIQLSKCFHANINAWIDNRYNLGTQPGDLVDLEGCDASAVTGGRYVVTNGSAVKFVQQNTFGNYDLISGTTEIEAFDNSHPAVILGAKSDTIGPGVNMEGNTTGTYIKTTSAGTHAIQNAIVSGNGSAHWLDMSVCPVQLNAQNNSQYTATDGPVTSPTSCPIWFNSSTLTQIFYNANPDSGAGLPFISNNTDSYRNGFMWYISPSNAKSLSFSDGCGGTTNHIAIAISGAFDYTQCTAGDFFNFYSSNSDAGPVTGSVTTTIVAYCQGGTGTLAIRGDDGGHGSTIQSSTISLAATPKTFTNAFAGAGSYTVAMIFMARPGTCASPRILSVGINAS